METINEFKKQQAQTVNVLKGLLCFLQEGEEYGVEVDPKYKLKLKSGIKATSDEKLKVALIGGFSEGKTSIAAAWSEKYDKNSMKINQQESSNEVIVYSMVDFDLVDTPGLFGYKESADKEKYKDITRKFVSESHLILYIMNPTNPIKESHKEELTWLFKDLHLLPRTVFVLSRFDEEADIEDESDYEKRLETKRINIIGRLNDFGISNSDLSIVAVSANPFDKGIEYWLLNLGEFRKLSHVETLQKATTEKIKASGSHTALIEASKKSIIYDILRRELPRAIELDEKTKIECERFQQTCDEVKKDLDKTRSNLKRTRIDLKDFFVNLFTDLIMQANGLEPDTIVEFFQREIGDEGIVLSTKIENEFDRQLDSTYTEIDKLKITLDYGIEQYNSVIGKTIGDFAKTGLKTTGDFLKSGAVNITNTAVLNARNVIMPTFKFKPWGAVKLAGNLNKALPIIGLAIGIGIEVWDSYKTNKEKKEFQEGIKNMIAKFNEQRKELLEFVNNEDVFISKCFPNIIELENQMEKLNVQLQEKKLRHENFNNWRKQGEAIEAEFTIIS